MNHRSGSSVGGGRPSSAQYIALAEPDPPRRRYHPRVSPFDTWASSESFQRLISLLNDSRDGPVFADGLWGSCAPITAGLAALTTHRPLLLITAHLDEADQARDDVETATGRAPELFPAIESLPGEQEIDDELAAERLRLCMAAAGGPAAGTDRDPIRIVAPIQALMQPVPTPGALNRACRVIARGTSCDLNELVAWLIESGYTQCDQVETRGDFARRGGILDVFSRADDRPIRIELFGDEIESIRLFDAGTQRSAEELSETRIPGLEMSALAGGSNRPEDTTGFMNWLPKDTLVAILEPMEVAEIAKAHWRRLGERIGLFPPEAVFRQANGFDQVHLQRFVSHEQCSVNFEVTSLAHLEGRGREALELLAELSDEGDVLVFCENEGERDRLAELLQEDGVRPDAEGAHRRNADGAPSRNTAPRDHAKPLRRERIRLTLGRLSRGFLCSATAYVSHHELFRRTRQRRTLRRVQPARPLDSFLDLEPGDLVVHVQHGIGRFRGLEARERDGEKLEYLAIEFAQGAVVHVPTSQIQLVQKYIGGQKGKIKLSKLGGAAWKRTKERVADAVSDMAADLIAVQARRAAETGVAFPPDTHWQQEFEAAFPYTETEDQLRTLSEIKNDLTRPRPMDRLVCGDVGFGKTELAIRAAFKVCEYGRQVAVLVPTTVLAEQHENTFRERMADYPFRIESLSRFRSPRDQKKIIEAARKGQVDVVIGTHRILSKDVKFADLGLVIIDEEQRFGVDAKERLKTLRATVDVLTLSATPIPRTLHMAMLGIRDISSLQTPPVDRRAIVTQVRAWSDLLLRDAIVRELSREGQVYFVHNFVRDIQEIANHVRSLVPDARVVVGHGQMKGHELEEVMLKFMRHEADILVSTNIIESGIDNPRANTMFINRADRFGLADLHQLRGRVGRSDHRAYCYLLLSPSVPVKDTAARRLKAIEHYSQLGAGFQIALRDLEIRGAGNILGAEQSGHIEAVGYEMYCQLLEQAVRRQRNQPAENWRDVNLDLRISASIPRRYVTSQRQRMDVYKRAAAARSMREIESLRGELRDVFGPPPEVVETLLRLAELRVLSQCWGVRSIVLSPPDVVFAVDDVTRVDALFSDGPGSPRAADARTVHWRLPPRLLEPARLLAVLREQLGRKTGNPAGARTTCGPPR